jgi:hypothetical protein
VADPIARQLVDDAIKRAARQLMEDAKAMAAPCGCSPNGTCKQHTRGYGAGSPLPDVSVGDRVTIRLPDGSMSRHVVTSVNPDGSFAMEREQEAVVGWLVLPGTDICSRCGDQNYQASTRECITCTPGLRGHDPELLERIMRLKKQGWHR